MEQEPKLETKLRDKKFVAVQCRQCEAVPTANCNIKHQAFIQLITEDQYNRILIGKNDQVRPPILQN